MAGPTKAQRAADAYRHDLMGPNTRQRYEDAVRAGIVSDQYAASKLHSGVAGGIVDTWNRGLPGMSELGAGLTSLGGMADDAMAGRPVDPGRSWQQARAMQQGNVDQFKEKHPVASNMVSGAALAAPVAAALATGGASLAPTLARSAPRTVASVVRGGVNAFAKSAGQGALIGGVYGAAQPGDFQDRSRNALSGEAIGGALGGIAPPVFGAASALAKVGGRYAATAGAGLRDVFMKMNNIEISKIVPPEVLAQGRDAALAHIEKMGVTPEALQAAVDKARDAPITGAEAMGAPGISQASGLARRDPETQTLAEDAMNSRGDARSSRILNHIQETTGIDPSSAKGQIEAMVAAGKRNADPLYEALRADDKPVWSSRLEEIFAREHPKAALKAARTQMISDGRDPHSMGVTFMEDRNAGGGVAPTYPGETVAPTAPRGPSKPPSQGASLARFIANNGGISDAGGEVANMGGDKWHIGKPYAPKLIGNGDTADGWGRRLQEAGYFPPSADPGEHDVLDALAREMRGSPTYARPVDDVAAGRFANADSAGERSAWEANNGGDVAHPDQYTGGTPPMDEPVDMPQPKIDTLMRAKQALQAMVKRDGGGVPFPDLQHNGNMAVNTDARDLADEIHRLEPRTKEADLVAGDYLSTKAAYDRGKGKLFGSAKEASTFSADYAKMSPHEQQATQAAAMNDAYERVINGKMTPGTFKDAVGKKLETMFGTDRAADLIDRMETEAAMSAASARMRPNLNSTTGDTLGSMENDAAGELGKSALKTAGNAMLGNHGGVLRGIGDMAVRSYDIGAQSGNTATRNAFGKYLYGDPETLIKDLVARTTARNALGGAAVPRSVIALQVIPARTQVPFMGQSPDQ